MNEEIYKKALTLITENEQEQKMFITCIKAGICPQCGRFLKVIQVENGFRIKCSCYRGLVSPRGVDYRFLYHKVWKRCINNEIRTLAQKYS